MDLTGTLQGPDRTPSGAPQSTAHLAGFAGLNPAIDREAWGPFAPQFAQQSLLSPFPFGDGDPSHRDALSAAPPEAQRARAGPPSGANSHLMPLREHPSHACRDGLPISVEGLGFTHRATRGFPFFPNAQTHAGAPNGSSVCAFPGGGGDAGAGWGGDGSSGSSLSLPGCSVSSSLQQQRLLQQRQRAAAFAAMHEATSTLTGVSRERDGVSSLSSRPSHASFGFLEPSLRPDACAEMGPGLFFPETTRGEENSTQEGLGAKQAERLPGREGEDGRRDGGRSLRGGGRGRKRGDGESKPRGRAAKGKSSAPSSNPVVDLSGGVSFPQAQPLDSAGVQAQFEEARGGDFPGLTSLVHEGEGSEDARERLVAGCPASFGPAARRAPCRRDKEGGEETREEGNVLPPGVSSQDALRAPLAPVVSAGSAAEKEGSHPIGDTSLLGGVPATLLDRSHGERGSGQSWSRPEADDLAARRGARDSSRRGSVDSTVNPAEWCSLIPADIYNASFSLPESSSTASTPQLRPALPPDSANREEAPSAESASSHLLPLSLPPSSSSSSSSSLCSSAPASWAGVHWSPSLRSGFSPSEEAAALQAVLAACAEGRMKGGPRACARPPSAVSFSRGIPACLGASRTLATFFEHILAIDSSPFPQSTAGKPPGLPSLNPVQRLEALQRLFCSLEAALHVHQALRLDAGMRIGGDFNLEHVDRIASSSSSAGPENRSPPVEAESALSGSATAVERGRGRRGQACDEVWGGEGGERLLGVWQGGISPLNLPIFLRVRQEQYLQQMREWSSAFPAPFDEAETVFQPGLLHSGERDEGGDDEARNRKKRPELATSLATLLPSASFVVDTPSLPKEERKASAIIRGEASTPARGRALRDGDDPKRREGREVARGELESETLSAASRRPLGLVQNMGLGMDEVKREKDHLEEGDAEQGQRLAQLFPGEVKGVEGRGERDGEVVRADEDASGVRRAVSRGVPCEMRFDGQETGTVKTEEKGEGDMERVREMKKDEKGKKQRQMSADSDGGEVEDRRKSGRGGRRAMKPGGNAASECDFRPEEADEEYDEVKPKRKSRQRAGRLEPLAPAPSSHAPQALLDPASPSPSSSRLSSCGPSASLGAKRSRGEDKKRVKSLDASAVDSRKREKLSASVDGAVSRRGDERAGPPSSAPPLLDSSTPRIPRKKARLLETLEEESIQAERAASLATRGKARGPSGAIQTGAEDEGGLGKKDSRPGLEEIDPWLLQPSSPPQKGQEASASAHRAQLPQPQPPPPPDFPPFSLAAFPSSRFNPRQAPGPAFPSDREGSTARWGDRAQRAGRPGDPVSAETGCGAPSGAGYAKRKAVGPRPKGYGQQRSPGFLPREGENRAAGEGREPGHFGGGNMVRAPFWSRPGGAPNPPAEGGKSSQTVRGQPRMRMPAGLPVRGQPTSDNGGAIPPPPPMPPPDSHRGQGRNPQPHIPPAPCSFFSLPVEGHPHSADPRRHSGYLPPSFPLRAGRGGEARGPDSAAMENELAKERTPLYGTATGNAFQPETHHVGYHGCVAAGAARGGLGGGADADEEEEEGQVSDGSGGERGEADGPILAGIEPGSGDGAAGARGHLGYRGAREGRQVQDEKEEGEEED
ncbi:putative retinitis pigmentosa 1-like 1 protein [Neospora caninum Liverpool]|uniref:Putative retinitis pigmentosa 1-like 1 protein n=1 Tax=Neospora caninum (strain Liverpool) TaxID=572307 RepID=F0VL01_NEOCL|nr:putative retinitis pigmentosa 1-like 1 protein [Neospora caninum Liverpool]CBZ54753.1 putative retinitis pigmentosa 1-like 1 protein [Neospora caninum Liverpool]|eukprot:XP_003884781.1 putative retinitis pigmentosa 1-like 1 protein [Neospora caninum Liverpool]